MSRKRRFIVILAGLAGVIIVYTPIPIHAPLPTHRDFRVEASQFTYSPAELTVNQGDTVTIELVSMDVVHGLYVDGYGASVTADPGQTATLTFVTNKSGIFRFRCNIPCGTLHPFMNGKLNVGPNTLLLRAIGLTLLSVLSVGALYRRPIPDTALKCALS